MFRRFRPLLITLPGLVLGGLHLLAGAQTTPGTPTTPANDWLIARKNGQWEFVAEGPAGRVAKTAVNQEVMRLDETGKITVLTLPPLEAGAEFRCPKRERYDYRSPCSSTFLDCRDDPAGVAMTVIGKAIGNSMEDSRNRLTCRIDTNAILHAARSVGMIKAIPPVPPAPPQTPWWKPEQKPEPKQEQKQEQKPE